MATLPYAHPALREGWSQPKRLMVIMLLGGGGLAVLWVVPVGTDELSVDAVTGSRATRCVWFGFGARTSVTVSPLERRLRAASIAWTPSWRTLSYRERNVFGATLSRGCSPAPPVLDLPLGSDTFAPGWTNEQLRQLVLTMQAGTRAQQEALIEAAFDDTMAGMVAAGGVRPGL